MAVLRKANGSHLFMKTQDGPRKHVIFLGCTTKRQRCIHSCVPGRKWLMCRL